MSERIEDEIIRWAKEAGGIERGESSPYISIKYSGESGMWTGSVAIKPPSKRNRYAYGRAANWSLMMTELLSEVVRVRVKNDD